ncbi:hypothetical protein [Actinomyces howellii]|uniref:DUF559 domain-containing protein n=1 Tax=Actinomyces howellii TaxID=52771 RepID=A0A3S4R372_9ACTO|nr:hypothetical protein [Actinomyces howellii]VEG27909.1 Uncharacterised protein [Actinomyces howellii]
MDADLRTRVGALVSRVDALCGAAHVNEVVGGAEDRQAMGAALALGVLHEPCPRLLVIPGTDHRIVRARHFRGRLTCASAAEVLGLPLWSAPRLVHVGVPLNHSVRPSHDRPTTGIRLHRTRHLTALSVDGFPLVAPAEVVACCLTCLDELDALCVADGALHRGLVTKEDVEELLTGRRAALARKRLAKAEAASRSPLETRTRLCLRDAGLEVEPGATLEGIGEVDMLVEGWLIVETDGYEFHSSREQIRTDRRREHRALADGYVTVRLTGKDVADGEATILRIVGSALRGVAHSSRIALPDNRTILRML